MKCPKCDVEMVLGIACPESLYFLRAITGCIAEFPEIHKKPHENLIEVLKCPKCVHSEHKE